VAQRGWTVAPGLETVVEEFDRNFTERGELGAGLAVVRDSELILDVWAGLADRQSARPWAAETLQLLFSGSKGLVATCLLILIDRGLLELDAPVSRYWPEFGKPEILVRHIASHTAGLPGLTEPVKLAELVDDQRMAALLARQEVSTDRRARETYHPLTFGWLCGELVRRIDGRTVGSFFADEVADPLELELWIGLPEQEEARVSVIEQTEDWDADDKSEQTEDPLAWSLWENPPFLDPASFPWNTRAFHAAEIPAANAIGTARSVAKLYGCLALGGEIDGFRLLREETVKLGRSMLSSRHDPMLDGPMAFGVGFTLATENDPPELPRDAFGHPGVGGSQHGAWPSQRIGYSYSMNQLRADPKDARARALLLALKEACQ
jgi:CubicO group peptidase (beta-lactamase class C family)